MEINNFPVCDVNELCREASSFSKTESSIWIKELYGKNDGKAVGTYLEKKFQQYLLTKYKHDTGNSARGIDCPTLNVDIKVTSIKQPQSSCPFESAKQKIYGLGYSLLVFVYEKEDDNVDLKSKLNILHTIFIKKEGTADYQTTQGILDILKRDGNKDDILAFLEERRLPVDEIEANRLADEIIASPPTLGYLTISNALQWRLQYSRAIEKAGLVPSIDRL